MVSIGFRVNKVEQEIVPLIDQFSDSSKRLYNIYVSIYFREKYNLVPQTISDFYFSSLIFKK